MCLLSLQLKKVKPVRLCKLILVDLAYRAFDWIIVPWLNKNSQAAFDLNSHILEESSLCVFELLLRMNDTFERNIPYVFSIEKL